MRAVAPTFINQTVSIVPKLHAVRLALTHEGRGSSENPNDALPAASEVPRRALRTRDED